MLTSLFCYPIFTWSFKRLNVSGYKLPASASSVNHASLLSVVKDIHRLKLEVVAVLVTMVCENLWLKRHWTFSHILQRNRLEILYLITTNRPQLQAKILNQVQPAMKFAGLCIIAWVFAGRSLWSLKTIEKKHIPFSGCISQSMLLTSDWLR